MPAARTSLLRRTSALFLLVALLGFGAIQLALHAALPWVEAHPQEVMRALSDALGREVRFTSLRARVRKFSPQLLLTQATLVGDDGAVTRIEDLRVSIALLRTALARQPRLAALSIRGVDLDIARNAAGEWSVGGIVLRNDGKPAQLPDWLLVAARARVQNARVGVADAVTGRTLRATGLNARLQRHGGEHALTGVAQLAGAVDGKVGFTLLASHLDRPLAQARLRGALDLRDTRVADVPTPGGPAHLSGDARLWVRTRGPELLRVVGDVSALGGLAGEAPQARRLYLRGVWQRRANGWVLGLDHARLSAGAARSEVRGITVARAGEEIRAYGAQLDLAPDARLWALSPLAPELSRALAETAPGVRLEALRVAWGPGGHRAHALVRSAAWKARRGVPGVAGVSGVLRATDEVLTLSLSGLALTLDLPKLYQVPLQLSDAAGELVVRRPEGRWRLELPRFDARVHNRRVAGGLRLTEGDPRRFLLVLDLPDVPVKELPDWLPDRPVDDDFMTWARAAFLAGTVRSPHLLLHGTPGHFFDADSDARFLVTGLIEDAALDYIPGQPWPQLSGANGALRVEGRSVQVVLDSGAALDTRLTRGNAYLEDFRAPRKTLALHLEGDGPALDLMRVLRETPLAKRVNAGVRKLDASGQAHSAFDLTVNLTGRKSVRADGRIDVTQGVLRTAGLVIDHIAGQLRVEGQAVSGSGISGTLLGGAATFALAPGEGGITRVTASGSAPAERLASYARLPPWLQGKAPWEAQLELSSSGIALDTTVDLTAVRVDAPAPLGKVPGVASRLGVQAVTSGSAEKHWRITAARDDGLAAALELAPAADDQLQLTRGDIAFGQPAQLPDAGLRVRAVVGELRVDPWVDFVTAQRREGGGALPISEVSVKADTLRYLGQAFAAQNVTLTPGPTTHVRLDGAQLAGTLELSPEGTAPIRFALERLHLPAMKRTLPDAAEPLIEQRAGQDMTDPATVSGLSGSIAEFRIGDYAPGAVRLETQPSAQGMAIRQLQFSDPAGDMQASGDWLRVAGGAGTRSTLSGTLELRDAGRYLSQSGLGKGVTGGSGMVSFKLGWAGGPQAFAPARLEGELDGKLIDGALADIQPGLGRLLGVLSLESIRRRLMLDFRDVFGQGFAFDDVRGKVTLGAGTAHTDKLRVRGPAAHLTLSGGMNLVDRGLDLDVNVVPQLTSSLPLAATIGSLGLGAALLVGQQLFGEQINEMSQQDYRVTGTLDNPVVTQAP